MLALPLNGIFKKKLNEKENQGKKSKNILYR